jgi:hypothetical protein
MLDAVRIRWAIAAFDPNIRPALWESESAMRATLSRAIEGDARCSQWPPC